MHPLSDRDLDRMSREAAEQSDVDQSPSGWEQLQQRLDKEMPPQKDKDRRRFLWIFFLFLLLSGSGLIWLLVANNKSTDKPIALTATSSGSDEKSKSVKIIPDDAVSSNKQSETTNNKTPESSAPTQPAASKTEQPIIQQAPSNNSPIDEKRSVAKPAYKKKTSSRITTSKSDQAVVTADWEKKRSSDSYDKKLKEQKAVDNVSSETIVSKEQTDKPKEGKVVAASANKDGKDVKEDLDNTSTATQPTNEESAKKKKDDKQSKPGRWSVAVVTGFDYSRISGTGAGKPGFSIGGQVYYDLNKRWSLNTGVVYTKKNYSAKGEDFTKPNGSWLGYVDLKSVTGDCYMWEIPINVRYNFTTHPRATIYASTGLSTYIMRKQAYTYDYMYNGVPTTRDWETTSQQNEWFKILNLSAGFETSINKSWSIQAEPYARIPLSGIGYGKMDINSYGILVGVKYRFSKVKTN